MVVLLKYSIEDWFVECPVCNLKTLYIRADATARCANKKCSRYGVVLPANPAFTATLKQMIARREQKKMEWEIEKEKMKLERAKEEESMLFQKKQKEQPPVVEELYEEEEGVEDVEQPVQPQVVRQTAQPQPQPQRFVAQQQSSQSKRVEVWQVGQVPSDFAVAIVNTQTQEVLDTTAAFVRVLNDLDYIKKVIG